MLFLLYNTSRLGKRKKKKRKCLLLPVQVECDNSTSHTVAVLQISQEWCYSQSWQFAKHTGGELTTSEDSCLPVIITWQELCHVISYIQSNLQTFDLYTLMSAVTLQCFDSTLSFTVPVWLRSWICSYCNIHGMLSTPKPWGQVTQKTH